MTDSKLEMAASAYDRSVLGKCDHETAFKAGAAWTREQQERVVHESLPLDKLNQIIEMIQRQNNKLSQHRETVGLGLSTIFNALDKLTGKDAPQPATDESGQSAGFVVGVDLAAGPDQHAEHITLTLPDYKKMMAELAKYRREVPALDAEIARLKDVAASADRQTKFVADKCNAEVERLTAQRDEYKAQVEGLIEVKRRLKSDLQGQQRETLRLQKQIENAKAMWS